MLQFKNKIQVDFSKLLKHEEMTIDTNTKRTKPQRDPRDLKVGLYRSYWAKSYFEKVKYYTFIALQ